MKTLLISMTMIGAVLSGVNAAELTDAQFTQMAQKAFSPAVAKNKVPGLVVGATVNGKHYVYAVGNTAIQGGEPVDESTIFELGSVSKTFNVVLAALAAERGLIDFDKPVSDAVLELKGSAFDQIKLVNLATHMSGGMPLQVPEKVKNNKEFFAYLAQWKPQGDPDATRSYSNVSIGLLGLVTGKAFNTSYSEAAHKHLFPELGLKSTYIKVPSNEQARYAYGFSRNSDKPIRVNPGIVDAEAYGIKSTATDMLHFVDLHLGEAETSAEMKAALRKTHIGYFETEYFTQAMLWEEYPWPVSLDRLIMGNSSKMALEPQSAKKIDQPAMPAQATYFNKTGSTGGFGAYVAFIPSQRIGVVMLANRNFPNEDRVKATYELIEAIEAGQR